MTSDKLSDAARADTLTVENNHNQYALHPMAFDYETLPPNLRNYHKGRIINDEEMPGYFDDFIPVAHDCGRGQVLKKKVALKTTFCDECDEKIPARKNERGESECPRCGLICTANGDSAQIIRDEIAAGRTTGGPYNNDY